MTNNSTRRGLAWGAAIALVGSMFGAMPAQADENISLTPLAGTATATFVDQQFSLVAATLNSTTDASVGKLKYQIEKSSTAGALSVSAESTTAATVAVGAGSQTTSATSTISVVVPTDATAVGTEKNIFSMQFIGASTASASVDVTVTAFIDTNNDGDLDTGEPRAATVVSFKKYADVAASVTFDQPIVGDTTFKKSGSITGINTDQLTASLIKIKSSISNSNKVYSISQQVVSGSISPTLSQHANAASLAPAIAVDDSVSGQVEFNGHLIGTATTVAVKAAQIDTVTFSAVAGDNSVASGSSVIKARVNSEFTFKVKTATSSSATAVASIPVVITATTSATLATTKTVKVNGTTYTVSNNASNSLASASIKVTTGTDGMATITVSTAGFSGGESISFQAVAQNVANTTAMVVEVQTPVFTVSNDNGGTVLTALGGTANLSYSVKDQWSVLSKRTNQQLTFTVTNPTGITSELDDAAVVAGKTTVALKVPQSTISGTITVRADLEKSDADTGLFSAEANAVAATVSVVVSSLSAALSTKPAASYSASISYGTAWSWSSVAAGSISANVGGASVVASGTDVVFEYDSKTYSGTVTLPADKDGKLPAFKMASRKAGSHTVSFTVGATSSSTLLVVDAAAFGSGKNLAVSTNYIDADAATQVTVTLTDENGNPVQVYGANSGSVAIEYVSNKGGAILGSIDGKTNAKGQFSFTILTGGNDNGSGTLTVTYNKDGANTATKDVISKAFTMTVGKAPATAGTTKITIGSFTGKVVVYAKGYTGKTVSYRIAGKWGKMVVTKDLQSATRKVGSGKAIKVDVYVDGSLVKTETITTK